MRPTTPTRATRKPSCWPRAPSRAAAALGSLALILGFSAPAGAEEPPEILNILSQFVASSTAAARCDEIDDDQMVAFLANQQMIYLQSVMALQEQHPEATGEQIAETLMRGQEDIQSQVGQRIDEHGCDDPNARALIELFAMQAEWRPGESPRQDADD
jgi:hypothetical protein